LNDTWQKLSVQKAFGATGVQAQIVCMTSGAQAVTFYLDGMYAGVGEQDWCLGGHRRLLGPSEGTIEFWAYVDDVVRRQIGMSMSYPTLIYVPRRNGTWGIAVRHRYEAAGWELHLRDDVGTERRYYFDDTHTPDGWHHFSLGWDDTEATVRVDGIRRATSPASSKPTRLGSSVTVGAAIGSTTHANTLFDDIRISSIKRVDEETLALYNSGQPAPYDEHTTYLWRADGPSAQRVTRAVVV
jgi:hypothetical protein